MGLTSVLTNCKIVANNRFEVDYLLKTNDIVKMKNVMLKELIHGDTIDADVIGNFKKNGYRPKKIKTVLGTLNYINFYTSGNEKTYTDYGMIINDDYTVDAYYMNSFFKTKLYNYRYTIL